MKIEHSNMRAFWLAQNLNKETRTLCERNGIFIPTTSTNPISSPDVWGDWKWHIKNRLSANQIDYFHILFPEYKTNQNSLNEYLKSYDLGILPLNLQLPSGVRKFLPKTGFKPEPDPYGVQRVHSVITHKEAGKKYYVTTHKPGYATFLPILGAGANRLYCPIACAGCYRGPQTRFNEPMSIIHADGTKESILIPNPVLQIKWLIEKWNKPEYSHVYDILLSGGEPMMLSNEIWEEVLLELKQAKHLLNFRICTGALFLGIPFRFDDKFIALLVKFRDETGVQIKLSTHISHPETRYT